MRLITNALYLLYLLSNLLTLTRNQIVNELLPSLRENEWGFNG